MPKARGRRPAPNPKKRAQRPAFRPVGASVAPERPLETAGGATAAAPALATTRTLAHGAPTGRRLSTPPVPTQRFRERVADYAYVGADLRRIAVLAGSLVVLLVALSFFVR